MSTRHTWLLLAVLAALIGTYWLVVSGRDRTVRRDDEARRLLDVPAEAVTSLAVRQYDDPVVRAVRTEEGWDIVAPLDTIPAAQGVWNRMAGQVRELRRERVVAEPPDELARYGLDAPVLAVEVEAGEDRRGIAFGGLEPTGVRRYALVDNEAVVLISDRTFREFDRPLTELRRRHLVDAGEAGITWLRFVRLRPMDEAEEGAAAPLLAPERTAPAEESVAVVVEQDGQGVWRLVEPVEHAADQEQVQALATEIQYGTARAFIDKPAVLADYGLNPPGARISVRSGDGPVQTLSLGWIATGEGEGSLYAQREGDPAVWVIDGHILTLLPTGPHSFQNRRLFTGNVADIVEIRYRHGDERLVLRRENEAGWRVARVADGAPVWLDDVDDTAVTAFVGAIKVIEVDSFVDADAAPGRDASLTVADITLRDGTERTIAVGDPVTDEAGIKRHYAWQDTGAAGTIGVFQAGLLVKSTFSFRVRRLLPFAEHDVAELHMFLDGEEHHLVRDGAEWRMLRPEPRRLRDSAPVDALLARLKNVAASGVAEDDGAGMTAPVLEARITTARGETLGPLRIGGAAGGDLRYATAAGRLGMFTVPHEQLEGVRDAAIGLRGETPDTPGLEPLDG